MIDGHTLGDVTTVLSGGGEMGSLMRSVDWSTTSLGRVGLWPQSLRSVVGMLVETLGGESRTATNGLDAIRCVTEFEPEAVLLDIGMPPWPSFSRRR